MSEETTTYPFQRGQFICSKDKECGNTFFASKEKVVEEDGIYFSDCPDCGSVGIESACMKNLHSTIGTAKGANMSKEGRDKSRLNGFTTGSTLLAKFAKSKIPLPPAKPDKYAECDDCQDKEQCKLVVEEAMGTCRPVYCHRKNEVAMKFMAAFTSGDPEQLMMVSAMNNANMQSVLNNSFMKIFQRGVEVVEKIIQYDKDGKQLNSTEKIYAHPLIKQCTNIMQAMGYTLSDATMTVKSKEAKDQVAGFLAASMGSGVPLEEVTEKIDKTVKNFGSLLQQASKLRKDDKTLIVFEAEEAQREDDKE